MDIQSQVEVTHLHCEYLRMLVDQLLSELLTIEKALVTPGDALCRSHGDSADGIANAQRASGRRS